MREAVHETLRAFADGKGRGYPDWAMRYAPVCRRLRPGLRPGLHVLEVGANENGLARFAQVSPVAIDLDPAPLYALRQATTVHAAAADAARLPFADAAFDVAVSMDTLEHLPPKVRPEALQEFVRVLKPGGVGIVAFPSGQASLDAEAEVAAAYARYTGRQLRWLAEHARHGLPDAKDVAQTLTEAAARHRVELRWRCSIAAWTWAWKVMLCGWPGRGNSLAQAILRVLAPALTRIHTPPCYRAECWLWPASDRAARTNARRNQQVTAHSRGPNDRA